MNRYLLLRLHHSLLLVRYYFAITLLIIMALIVTTSALHAAESSDFADIERSQPDMQKGNLSQGNTLILTSPILYAYPNREFIENSAQDLTAQESTAIRTEAITQEEALNNESLHATITDLISQHEVLTEDEPIELVSQPLATQEGNHNNAQIILISPKQEDNTLKNSILTLNYVTIDHPIKPFNLETITESSTNLATVVNQPSGPFTIDIVTANERYVKESTKIEATETVEEETPLNNYLLYALFPHHKEQVLQAPLSKAYKENHENHEGELSIIKLADKIDTSLSFNEDSLEMQNTHFDEDAEFEVELAEEGYFDSYQDYQEHYKNIDEESVLLLESQSYPYVQDLQLEEELSSAEFVDLSINQQIEQLLTTGDYYILADDIIKGRQYYIQAVRIGAKEKNAPAYAKALVKLADLEENPYLARFQYTNALDIYETHTGFDMEIADILVKLVWTFDVTTERIVIYELLTSAKQILEKYAYSPQYTMVLRNLAIYYEAADEFDKADAHYQAALALDLEHLTTNDIRTILALENYAAFYLKFQEYSKAEEILLFKLNAHEEAETTDYYNLGRTQSMLGWTYLQQHNFDEALHYYNAALGNINYSITKNRFMPHYYSLPAIFDLIYLFNITYEPERGLPYFQVARALLASENESATLEYLKETPKEQIDLSRIIHYPWAATAEIEGLITIMDYIDNHEDH